MRKRQALLRCCGIHRNQQAAIADTLFKLIKVIGLPFCKLLEARSPRYVSHIDEKDLSKPYGHMFGRLLESLKPKKDPRTETERTLYSIRHYFATRALTRTAITPYQLAEHRGTRVQMINKHYGHLDLRKVADKFAGAGTVHDALIHPDEPEESDDHDAPAEPKKKKGRPKKSASSGDNTASDGEVA